MSYFLLTFDVKEAGIVLYGDLATVVEEDSILADGRTTVSRTLFSSQTSMKRGGGKSINIYFYAVKGRGGREGEGGERREGGGERRGEERGKKREGER